MTAATGVWVCGCVFTGTPTLPVATTPVTRVGVAVAEDGAPAGDCAVFLGVDVIDPGVAGDREVAGLDFLRGVAVGKGTRFHSGE